MVELMWKFYDPEGQTAGKISSIEDMFQKAAGMEITRDVFAHIRTVPRFDDILQELDIPEEEIFDLFETLDADGSGTIDLEELIDGIAKLRGGPRRSDIIAVNFMLRSVQQEN